MKQAIVNFCKSMDTGLFLLDMPTGFGKTYSVLDFMVDNYDAPEFKDKKIFFVTTLKKMLMYGKVSQENYVELTAASAIPNKEIKSPQILRY